MGGGGGALFDGGLACGTRCGGAGGATDGDATTLEGGKGGFEIDGVDIGGAGGAVLAVCGVEGGFRAGTGGADNHDPADCTLDISRMAASLPPCLSIKS